MRIAGNSVGIDYHSGSIQVHVMDEVGKKLGSKRLESSVERVIEYASKFGRVKGVAIEACTGSAVFAEALKEESGWGVKLCHPGYVQRMRHNPDKSDKSDAYLLSDLHRVGYLPEVWLAPEEIRDLRGLVRYRKQLVEQRKEVKLRIRAILRQDRIKLDSQIRHLWTKLGLQWLASIGSFAAHTQWIFDRHLKDLNRLSAAIVESDERIEEVVSRDLLAQHLLKKKGVGNFTAAVMRAEIGKFTRFRNGKQLARFCGVSPRNCSSGERQADAGLIKAGN
jgi:transposase